MMKETLQETDDERMTRLKAPDSVGPDHATHKFHPTQVPSLGGGLGNSALSSTVWLESVGSVHIT